MKFFKALNAVNLIATFLYIPVIILGYIYPFDIKIKSEIFTDLGIIIALITMICSLPVMIKGASKFIRSSYTFDDIKKLKKTFVVPLLTNLIVSNAFVILFTYSKSSDNTQIFVYSVATVVATGFIFGTKIIILRLENTNRFIMDLPWFFFTVPFIVFIGGSILASAYLPEEQLTKVVMCLFILAGVGIGYLAFHGFYQVDIDNAALIHQGGIKKLFSFEGEAVGFAEIKQISVQSGVISITCKQRQFKVRNFYSNTKKFIELMEKQGVSIICE